MLFMLYALKDDFLKNELLASGIDLRINEWDLNGQSCITPDIDRKRWTVEFRCWWMSSRNVTYGQKSIYSYYFVCGFQAFIITRMKSQWNNWVDIKSIVSRWKTYKSHHPFATNDRFALAFLFMIYDLRYSDRSLSWYSYLSTN